MGTKGRAPEERLRYEQLPCYPDLSSYREGAGKGGGRRGGSFGADVTVLCSGNRIRHLQLRGSRSPESHAPPRAKVLVTDT